LFGAIGVTGSVVRAQKLRARENARQEERSLERKEARLAREQFLV
jgi:hypothetical protein